MPDYDPVYSRDEFLKNRISPEPDQTAKEHIDNIAEDIDGIIHQVLRTHLGLRDKNGFEIILPLDATITKIVIDIYKKTVKLPMERTIQKIADDYIIAEYHSDQSETVDRLERVKKDIISAVERLFGVVISSVPLDFTTKFAVADKIGSENGEYIGDSATQQLLTFDPVDTSATC